MPFDGIGRCPALSREYRVFSGFLPRRRHRMSSKKKSGSITTILAAVGIVLTATVVEGAFAQAPLPVEIALAGDSLFFDRDLGLHIRGLDSTSEVVVTVSATDARGQAWWSQNVYLPDDEGEIDPSRQGPIRGTYSGVHSMGPFWSMVGAERFDTSSGADLRIRVSRNDTILADRSVKWLSPRDHEDVIREAVRRPDLVANLYLPRRRQDPVPAVLVLGGSGGGFNGERASLLATHGYAALDVAYFGVEGTPEYFVESVPLEYFMGAVSILEQDPRIDASRIAVMGKSYGAQLALLLASHDSRISLVSAEAASSFVTGTSATYPVGPTMSAWSLAGEGFPFLRAEGRTDASVDPKQISISSSGEVALDQVPAARRAAIPAERINGPVLLLTGGDDRLWESTVMAEQLIRRMTANDFTHGVRHVHYPDAGHNIGGGEQAYGVPNLPPRDRGNSSGGTRQGNSVAGVAGWLEVLAFLRSHFF